VSGKTWVFSGSIWWDFFFSWTFNQ